MRNILTKTNNLASSHPSVEIRVDAVKKGWENAKANVGDRELSMGIEDYYNLGREKMIEGKYEEALEAYSVAVQLDPKYYKSYTNRAKAWLEIGNYEKAIQDNTMSIEIKPTWIAFHNRGVAYQNIGENKEAIINFSNSIKLNPKYNYNYSSRGYSYFIMDDLDKAISDYNSAISSTESYDNTDYEDNYTEEDRKKDISTFYFRIAQINSYKNSINQEIINVIDKALKIQ